MPSTRSSTTPGRGTSSISSDKGSRREKCEGPVVPSSGFGISWMYPFRKRPHILRDRTSHWCTSSCWTASRAAYIFRHGPTSRCPGDVAGAAYIRLRLFLMGFSELTSHAWNEVSVLLIRARSWIRSIYVRLFLHSSLSLLSVLLYHETTSVRRPNRMPASILLLISWARLPNRILPRPASVPFVRPVPIRVCSIESFV